MYLALFYNSFHLGKFTPNSFILRFYLKSQNALKEPLVEAMKEPALSWHQKWLFQYTK